ncbi:MAG TPA: response regulator [Thermoanaerobaculia bacterium]|nr:response regulator [Thermoanaerobaculia bacterium]
MSVAVADRTTLPPQLLHDLRSPLNQIIGYSELLTEEAQGTSSESVVADLRKVRAAGHRMLALIEQNFTASTDEETSAFQGELADDAAAERTPIEERRAARGSVLVVDDDATNRDVLSRRLERQGHRVETASNGPDALDVLRARPFDVVLLDIMMPDMDGYEVLGRIKSDARLRQVPVIMISAIDDVQSVVRCIEAGADDYLTKPFAPALLKARIGASLGTKRGRDRETALYERLQQNYKRLLEVEKLRDDMRNMIVHDLRTPLTSLLVGMEMVGTGELTGSQRQMMDIATSGGRTLLGMINDLLDVEKMESGTTRLQYTTLSVSALVTAAVEQVAPLAAMEETSLEVILDSALPAFAGDANKLSRTLVNLIANAIKFTGRGVVMIMAAHDDAGGIRFSVRDTGRGIPAEAFERIFEKFGQVDGGKDNVGTGLGLAFCKLAVEAHGGRIAVESTPGSGSTFSFTIPITPRGHAA